ncbi:MAG: tetratricopeptide repeat protein [Phycisphaerae bacterium]
MQTNTFSKQVRPLLLAVAMVLGLTQIASAQERESRRPVMGGVDNYAARAMLKKATDLMAMQETDRSVKMLEKLIEQYPASPVRYEAYLELGKHYMETGERIKGIDYLKRIRDLERKDGKELTGKSKEIFLEALYRIGVGHYKMRQYPSAFPVLRKITRDYPNSIWANQAYYYIGMCHFSQQNWNKAIEALKLVGTFVDPDSPTAEYVEAGRRFFVKIEDNDLPILHRLGKKTKVTLKTSQGDEETVECEPLSEKRGLFIAQIGTEVGQAKKGDGTLQVIGGDSIKTVYLDDNTEEGEKDLPRDAQVKVVSTASVNFTLGTLDTSASAAFLGQPLHIVLRDVDRDRSPRRDSVRVKIISRYKSDEESDSGEETLREDLSFDEQKKYKIRDQVTLELPERGEQEPLHSGNFAGKIVISPAEADEIIDKTDDKLKCVLGDEVVAMYIDELHIAGESPKQVSAKIKVSGEVDPSPRATQNVVSDPVLRAEKNMVEATAYRELARIFKSLGLRKGAALKADQGLERVEPVIRSTDAIPADLKQQAFKLKWQLYLAQEDYANAVGTCTLFSKLYPESPFVDNALLEIGKIRMKREEYGEAIGIFQKIISLEKSLAKAEAQFLIAQATEKNAKNGVEAAIRHYKLCAEKYPESEYAGPSLGKLVNYYIDTKDYVQAESLLTQVFEDHPDAAFLDQMLMKWALVSVRQGDLEKAAGKLRALISQYPDSKYAETAKSYLENIQNRLNQG